MNKRKYDYSLVASDGSYYIAEDGSVLSPIIVINKLNKLEVELAAFVKREQRALDVIEENKILREMVRFWEQGNTEQGEYEGLVMALAEKNRR